MSLVAFETFLHEYSEVLKKDISVCLPAKIKEYNSAKQNATIQIMLKDVNALGQEYEIKPLFDIPVWQFRGQSFYIHQPIEENTMGFLIVFDKSIDMYKTYGDCILPQGKMKHDANDSIFIPGFYPQLKALQDIDNSKLTISSIDNKTQITIDKDGNIEAKNEKGSFQLTQNGAFALNNEKGSITLNSFGNTFLNSPAGIEFNTPTATFKGNVEVESGATGFFATLDGKIVTVTNGIITGIVG